MSVAVLAAVLLSGCSGGGGGTAAPAPPGSAQFSGVLHGGQQPVVGALVTLYAAGSTAYGGGDTSVGSTHTDGSGNWTINFSCPSGNPLIYAVATGGNPGVSNNNALGLSAILGPCNVSVSENNIQINEVTTVASIYALAPFLDSSGQHLGTSPGNATGLVNAAANAANLADVTTGLVSTSVPANITIPEAKLNSLADLIATCVNSAGGSAGDGSACGQLFAAAQPPAGAAPATTLQALLDIAQHPANNAAALYNLVPPSPVFTPSLNSAPTDWTLALRLSGGGLAIPRSIAIDAKGNAWIANMSPAAVSKFSPSGAPLSGSTGFTGGGLYECIGIAVDGSGQIWVTDEESPSTVNHALGAITKLAADGTILSGASGYTAGGINFPESLAIDSNGNVWVANYGNGTVTQLRSDGTAASPPSPVSGGGLGNPVSVSIDSADHVWISDQGNSHVTHLDSGGAVVAPAGYAPAGLSEPNGICADASGNLWISSYLSFGVVQIAGSASGSPGVELSPSGGYSVGSNQRPDGCAVDGAGKVWITNFRGNTVAVLAGSGSTATGTLLSGPSGYAQSSLSEPDGIAVDASGNVWISNESANNLTVLIGAATPVKTPLIGPPALP